MSHPDLLIWDMIVVRSGIDSIKQGSLEIYKRKFTILRLSLELHGIWRIQ